MTAERSPDDHGADEPRPRSPSGDPLAHLFAAVLADARRLVRGEIALLRAELRAALVRAGTGIALLAGAIAIGIAAMVMLAQAMSAGLHALGLPPPAAAAATAFVLVIAAGACGYLGLRRLSPAAMLPGRSIRNLGRTGAALFRKENDDE